MVKKLLFTLVMMATILSAGAATKQALTLHITGGARIVYFLDTKPEITFSGQDMVVTVADESSAIPMADVDRWEIGMVDEAGSTTMPSEQVSIAINGNTVTVTNPAAGAINVFNITGINVATAGGDAVEFTLPRGIYIINVANNSYKIAIR